MRNLTVLALGLCLLVGPAAGEAEKGKDKGFDTSKLTGTWKVTAGAKFGEKLDPKTYEGTVTITDDTITIKDPSQTHKMTYKLDTKAKPIAITMTGTEGPAKDMVAEGIIELKGDELKLCYALPGEKRPTKFESSQDSKTLAFTLKRSK